MPLRSLLFVPGDRPDRIAKALATPADAVIVDLEDAVANANKARARDGLGDALSMERFKPVYVRTNAVRSDLALHDISAAVAAGADGLILPKVESAFDVAAAEWLLDQLGAAAVLDVILILETARGIADMPRILKAATRARRANIGAGDLGRDLNLSIGPEETELLTYRAALVAECRANDFHPPLDTVWGDLRDEAGLRSSARRAQRLGFCGKLAIHPRQVGIINEVFSPSAEEVERAMRIAQAFDAAEAGGNASIEVDGAFVDYPVAERAQRTLETARLIAERDGS